MSTALDLHASAVSDLLGGVASAESPAELVVALARLDDQYRRAVLHALREAETHPALKRNLGLVVTGHMPARSSTTPPAMRYLDGSDDFDRWRAEGSPLAVGAYHSGAWTDWPVGDVARSLAKAIRFPASDGAPVAIMTGVRG